MEKFFRPMHIYAKRIGLGHTARIKLRCIRLDEAPTPRVVLEATRASSVLSFTTSRQYYVWYKQRENAPNFRNCEFFCVFVKWICLYKSIVRKVKIGKGTKKKRSTYVLNRQTHENRYMNSYHLQPRVYSFSYFLLSFIALCWCRLRVLL